MEPESVPKSQNNLLLLALIQDEKNIIFQPMNYTIVQGRKKWNISLTKARIYIKFLSYAHNTVIDHQKNFHEDWCTYICGCVSHKLALTRFIPCEHVYRRPSPKNGHHHLLITIFNPSRSPNDLHSVRWSVPLELSLGVYHGVTN